MHRIGLEKRLGHHGPDRKNPRFRPRPDHRPGSRGSRTDSGRHAQGNGALHEPGAGDGATRRDRRAHRRLCSGGHPLRNARRPTTVRHGRRSPHRSLAGRMRGAADASQRMLARLAQARPGHRDHRRQGPRKGAAETIRLGAGHVRRHQPLPELAADHGSTAERFVPAPQVHRSQPHARGRNPRRRAAAGSIRRDGSAPGKSNPPRSGQSQPGSHQGTRGHGVHDRTF